MSVIKDIESGKLEIQIVKRICKIDDVIGLVEVRENALSELLRLAETGERMQWIPGVPPAFGQDERKWIIFEYLTPFTKTKSYITTLWLGESYSEPKVKLAKRWMPLPELPKDNAK